MVCIIFPSRIFNSHLGLFYIPIVYLQFPLWFVLYSHLGLFCIPILFPPLFYISILYLLFPSWFVLYSHRVSSIPILVCFIFLLCIFNSHYGLFYKFHLGLFYILILFPPLFVLYSHSIPTFVCFILPFYIFYSYHGLCTIPIMVCCIYLEYMK